MANWVKNLLNIEDEKIKESKNRKATYTCKYLSSLLGEKVEIELQQLSDKQYKHFMAQMVPEDEQTSKGELVMDNVDVYADMVTYSITDKEILSQEVMDKFHVTDTISLVKKMLPGSELFEIGGRICELCEYEIPTEAKEEKKKESES